MPEAPLEGKKGVEATLVTTLLVGVIAVLGGVLLGTVPDVPYSEAAPTAIGFGIVVMALSFLPSFDVDTLRWITRGRAGATRYEQLRRWTRLKVAVLFLSLMVIFGIIVLGIALLARIGMIAVETDSQILRRVLSILLFALGFAVTYAHYQSLRIKLERDRSGLNRGYHMLGVFVAGLAGLAAGVVAYRDQGMGPFEQSDWPFLGVFALTILGVTVFITRTLPTPHSIFSQDPSVYRGHTYFSRGKSVVLPTLTAFGLLFVLLLVFLVFGVGVLNVVEEVVQSTVVLIFLAFLALAVIGSFGAAMFLARQEDKPVLYRKERTKEQKTATWILALSLTAAAILFVLAAFLGIRGDLLGFRAHAWIDVFAVGVLVTIGPFGFYRAHQARHVRRLEARFPDFLRDLASSHQGGLTMPASVFVAAKGDYGELTPEIHKLADQLSWNVAFDEALHRFGERVKTPIVERTISLILEATRSGGSTSDVLLAAGRDAREIKTLENQRRLTMSLYTSVIYITFLVFLVVVAILDAQFVPEIIRASEAAVEQGATGIGSVGFQTPSEIQFRTFYFMAAIVQGLGDGIVAGMMSSGRFALGLRHSFLMVLIAFLAFVFFL